MRNVDGNDREEWESEDGSNGGKMLAGFEAIHSILHDVCAFYDVCVFEGVIGISHRRRFV